MSQITPQQLYNILHQYFSLSELRDLCFATHIPYEDLSGSALSDKAREMVQYAQRHIMYDELVAEVQKRRPQLNWRDPHSLAAPPATPAGTPASTPPEAVGTVIHIHGNVVGSAIGGGSVTAANIAGHDVIVGSKPTDPQQFAEHVQALHDLVQQAIHAGEIPDEREAASIAEDVQEVASEAQAQQPRATRMQRRLQDIAETLTAAAAAAEKAGKAGAAVIKALPIVKALLAVVSSLF